MTIEEPETPAEEPKKKRVQQFMRDNRAAFVLARQRIEARWFEVVDGRLVNKRTGQPGIWCPNCGAMMVNCAASRDAHGRFSAACKAALEKYERGMRNA